MSSIILPSRWTSQPQGAVEVNPEYGTPHLLYVGSSGDVSPIGLADTKTIPHHESQNVYGEYTMLWYGMDDAFASVSPGSLLAKGSGANWSNTNYYLEFAYVNSSNIGGIGLARRSSAGGANYVVVSAGIPHTKSPMFVAVTGGPLTNSAVAMYVNGMPLSSSVTDARSVGLPLTSTLDVVVGSAYNKTALGVILPRKLSDSEIFGLSENPWQIFKKRPRILYFDAVGGGGITAGIGSFTLTGNDAGLLTTRKVTADVGAFTLIGNDAGLLTTRKVTADVGAFTLIGNDATLTKTTVGAFTLTCDVATFTVAGTAAGLVATRTLPTTTASFALAGITTGLLATRSITAEPGAFALTGNSAGLVYNPVGSYTLSANTGTFNLTGVATGLVYTPVNVYTLTADIAVFALGGIDAGLRATRTITAATGTVVLTGSAAWLGVARKITTGTGAFAATGNEVTLRGPSRVTAETGVFAFTGRSANLIFSGYDPLANEKYKKGVRVYHVVDDVTARTSTPQVRVTHTTPQVRI